MRVCGGGNLADARRQRPALRAPQLDAGALAHAEFVDPCFRQRDGDLARAVGGEPEHHLPWRHHLPGFGLADGDHAVAGRAQLRVGGLVAGHVVTGARGFGLAGGGGMHGFLCLQRRAADQLLRGQLRVTRLVGRRACKLGFGRGQLRLRGACLQLQVARIQFRQQLSRAHAIAHVHQPAHQLAADAERQCSLLACAHFARIGERRCAGRGLRMCDQDRAWRDHGGVATTAGGECERQDRGSSKLLGRHRDSRRRINEPAGMV